MSLSERLPTVLAQLAPVRDHTIQILARKIITRQVSLKKTKFDWV